MLYAIVRLSHEVSQGDEVSHGTLDGKRADLATGDMSSGADAATATTTSVSCTLVTVVPALVAACLMCLCLKREGAGLLS